MPINGPKQVANQQISALHADSTVRALVVHNVDASGAYVSPGAGSTQVSIKEILTSSGGSIIDSSNNSIGVTIRAGSAAGTEYADGDTDTTPNGGGVFFMNGSNTMRVVSATTPLPVSGTFSASTIVSVAALPLVSTSVQNSASSALSVRVVGGVSSAVDFPVRALFSSTKADNLVTVYQSSAADFNVTVAGYVAPSTTISIANSPVVRSTNSVAADLQATVTPVAGSTWNVRPLQSSAADLQATVTPVAGSTWNVRPLQSSAADLQATVTPAAGSTWSVRPLQSSQADLRVTVYQSSRAELLNTVYQSSRTELLATVYQSSQSEFKVTSYNADVNGALIESSTKAVGVAGTANSTMRGLAVRQCLPALQTFASSNTFTSSAATIASSNAATVAYVYAYSITSTNQSPTKIAFYTGTGTLRWPIVLAAISSAVTGANLAVSPPAYLFAGSTGTALTLNIPSSGVGWKVGVSYWTE